MLVKVDHVNVSVMLCCNKNKCPTNIPLLNVVTYLDRESGEHVDCCRTCGGVDSLNPLNRKWTAYRKMPKFIYCKLVAARLGV